SAASHDSPVTQGACPAVSTNSMAPTGFWRGRTDVVGVQEREAIDSRLNAKAADRSCEHGLRAKGVCDMRLGAGVLQDLSADLGFAIRAARKARWFTAVAVSTLALSIGLNATLFAIVTGMANTPPVDAPDRLVSIGSVDAAGRLLGASYQDVDDWRR